jgi:HPt (histidine-containing phosphotransfer) domain-containing protein
VPIFLSEVAMAEPPTPPNKTPILSQYATDPEMVELIELFLSEMPDRLRALESAWRNAQVPQLTRMAHQLKGSCAGYGFPSIGTAASALEERLRTLQAEATSAQLTRLQSEFNDLIDLCRRASAA